MRENKASLITPRFLLWAEGWGHLERQRWVAQEERSVKKRLDELRFDYIDFRLYPR